MGETFAEFGDLVFSLVIGYISAIEFLYVVRHLYHYSFNHDANDSVDDSENLSQLQDSMRQQLANAKNREAVAGTQVMKDGVPYKDGFRLDAQQALIDQLKEQLKDKELSDLRRKELEKELAAQMKIAEKLRKELAEAEAKYQRQLKQEEEAKAKKLLEEKRQQEQEELSKREAEEQARKQRKEAEEEASRLAEVERKKELEQKQREEAEENDRRLREAERQREQEQRQYEEKLERERERERVQLEEVERREAEEQARILAETERQREIEQQQREQQQLNAELAETAELAPNDLLAIEHRLEEQLRAAEKEAELTEKELQLIDSIKNRELNEEKIEGGENREAELLRKILQAREQLGEESEEEQSFRLLQRERDQELKQKRIEENALLFMEAEKEMAELQSKMFDTVEKRIYSGNLDSASHSPVIEEPCIKRTFSPLTSGESSHSTVKTQLAQDLDEPYSVRTKPLLFPGVSDDASSIDPASSQKSSFSTQPSEEITTGTDSQYPAVKRQDPDGEDTALTDMQYSEDYLRSLDGIKQRPLVREDGSGRRRAFKKRRSSNSSNSSRESRHSRDEELKMFTSLEEEEMKDTTDSEFTPIRYTAEPTLRVKGHHRRHKRSPAKDSRRSDDSLRSSLERLGEETNDPWGEVKPEHYKHTEFWKKEKASSIDEEMEYEKPASSEEVAYDTATNMPSASSFEEATQKQNQAALTTLQKHSIQTKAQEGKLDEHATAQGDTTNLQAFRKPEKESSPARASHSPHLRLSARMEDTKQFPSGWKGTTDATDKSPFSTAQNTPTINVQTPLDYGSWRDEHGLMMEGLSDFYDFTASINPSRSRPTSRNVSPANTAPNTPLPKDVSFQSSSSANDEVIQIYDDTENVESEEFKMENIIKFIDSLNDIEDNVAHKTSGTGAEATKVKFKKHLQHVADDAAKSNQLSLVPLVNVVDEVSANALPNFEDNEFRDAEMNTLVSSLRSREGNRSHSRSRSKSPLPTPDNLKRSVENRRFKMIKHNEDILEKLIESKLLPELPPLEETETKSDRETNQCPESDTKTDEENQTNTLVQTLEVERRRSRSKSPMRLPTVENLSKGLEKRRTKLIERNDELIKQLEERSQTPESPTIYVQHVAEVAIQQETENPLASTEEENDCSREQMDLLVQSLRVARSKTKSKSPMRINEVENRNKTSEVKYFYEFQRTECVAVTQGSESINVPTISIEFSEDGTSSAIASSKEDKDDCSREKMDLLIQSLRQARSRSTSKSPMNFPADKLMHYREQRATTPEPSSLETVEVQRSRYSRSSSPSRSHSISPEAATGYRSNTPSRSLSPQPDEYDDFHVLLNLEGSKNRTLSISTEEQESLLIANRQKQLDEQALEKLRNASEEVELRTLSPLILNKDELSEERSSEDYLTISERSKLLRTSPTTPDYDRTISEEVRDVERIKQEMLKRGFKRSTYVGESMDLGSEFETLRREAAKFQRSRSPSPSFSAIESAAAQRNAEERRKIQDLVLQELTKEGKSYTKDLKNTGAIPKTERFNYSEVDSSPNSQLNDGKYMPADTFGSQFQHSANADYSEEQAANFEELRRRNAEFRRSASATRSPFGESVATKRVVKDKLLNEEYACRFNTDLFENARRASDSTLLSVQPKDDIELEPEEYHHYRRFSLAQEESVEQYPRDDYIFIEQVEVRTRSGSRTWVREDFYSENVDEYLTRAEESQRNAAANEKAESAESGHDQQDEENMPEAPDDDEDYSNASDDDRQTVVEVDDEIDEDISDFNERGPAEESHHETSECEEAEREMDRYAGREASDWNRPADVDNILISGNPANEMIQMEQNEGAVGGSSASPYDSDSFAIDQIYDEAIKNRKQSGILREYDSILMQMSVNSDIDEQYLKWPKKSPKNIEFNTQFLDHERKDAEIRYLGDANINARQSARLRSRYGYNPVLQGKCIEDELEVDLNYKPKHEYNWRKNFKLDEDIVREDKEITLDELRSREDNKPAEEQSERINYMEANEENSQIIEGRTSSPARESITLLSRSSDETENFREKPSELKEEYVSGTIAKEEREEVKEEKLEKPKKKKTKKKAHKESKASLEETMNREDEDAYDNLVYCRRSSSIHMDTDSPKRKSHSRRSSKSSLANEDNLGLFSPRSSVACNEAPGDIKPESMDVSKETARPKKMKKRKKVKEFMTHVAESPIESREDVQYDIQPLNDVPAVSSAITPESSNANILSTLSPQNSVCVTPASIDTDINLSVEELRECYQETGTTGSSTTASSSSGNLSRTSSITHPTEDTFDILKDANFYPLF